MTHERDPVQSPATPALRETARRRADLYLALIALEQAIARPATDREHDWIDGVVDALDDLEREISSHVEVTEGEDGLYDEIAAVAPRLLHRVDALRSEHQVMTERTRDVRERLETTPAADAATIEGAREEIRGLLGLVVRHRQRGSDLVWEAYQLDIGGIG